MGMRRIGILVGLGAAAVLMAGCASLAALAGPRVFEILNDTDKTAERLYFHASGAGGGQEDLLGQSVLRPGRWTEAPLTRAQGCRYDLRAVMADGATIRARNIDVCATRGFRLSQGERERPRVGGARGGVVVGAGEPPMSRGLPICPGDPRCKRKK